MQRYAITDRSLLPAGAHGFEAALDSLVATWVSAGIDWVQLREKDLPVAVLASLVRRLAALVHTESSKTRLLINGLPVVDALASGADGVHLRSGATAESIRGIRDFGAHVSVSCHTPWELDEARKGGADAVLWAPVFGKTVRGADVHMGTGLDALSAAVNAARPVAVFALGGVTAENAEACLRAGAAGVAGIRLFHGEGWRQL